MKNKNNTNLEKNNEIMETQGKEDLSEISKSSKILQNSNNIFIIFKRSKIHIKLLNRNSLQQISSLLNIKSLEKFIKLKSGPELSDTDSDNDSKNGLKGIAKLKERLNKSDNNNNSGLGYGYYEEGPLRNKKKNAHRSTEHFEKERFLTVECDTKLKSLDMSHNPKLYYLMAFGLSSIDHIDLSKNYRLCKAYNEGDYLHETENLGEV